MNLGDYLSVVRRRWVAILAITLIVFGGAALLTYTAPKVYTATAQNFVALTSDSTDQSNPLTGAQFAAQRVKSYTEIVTSPDVLAPVVEELKLPYSAQQLSGKVSATNPPLTVLLLVSAVDSDPDRAAAIANAASINLGRTIENLETPNAKTIAPVKVTLTDPAQPPSAPSSPRRNTNLILGLIFGLAAGLAYAFIRNALDNTVKTVQELDRLATAPSLGLVIFDPNAKTRVLSALDPTSAHSEGYRTIRTNLQFINVDDPVRAMVVTSAAPGDGKTTVACNLAIAVAQSGKSVCLVESDLRRPRVAEYLQISSGVGLTEVLAGQAKLSDALQPWGKGLLHVLPPGSLPPNPSELLGSQQMAQVIATLKSQFDVVILDTPPLLAVSDAAVLASQADGAVVVVRYGKSSREAIRHAIGSLEQIDAKILGTVLNAVPAKRGRGYGYGYGYTDHKADKSERNPANLSAASADE